MNFAEYTKFLDDTELRELYRQREKTRHDILSYTKTMVRKAREEGFAEGLAEARAKRFAEECEEGDAEGRKKRRWEITVELTKICLRERFGQWSPAITSFLERKAENVPDETESDRIFELALKCASLDDFEASL